MAKRVFLGLSVALLAGLTQVASAGTGLTLAPPVDTAHTTASPTAALPVSLLAEDPPAAIAADSSLVGGCSSCGPTVGSCGACDPCAAPTPFKLFGDSLGCTGIVAGGWIQQGFTVNGSDPVNGLNGSIYTNHQDSEYMLNQAWLYFIKPVNTAGCSWDVGGRIDLVYGSDWLYAASEGLESQINAADANNGFILPQAYAEFGGYDWSIKVGRYATMWGHEVIPAPANFFYSHSLSMSGAASPLLVTGIQADKKLSDRLTLIGGVNRGWLSWEDNNDAWDLLGGVKWTSCDKRSTLSFMSQTGAWDDPDGDLNRFAYALVGTHQVSDRLSYAFQHNLGYADNHAPGGGDAEWYSLAQYLTYTINPCWSAGARLEIFRDDDGARVLSFGSPAPGNGFAGDFTNLSLGLNWRPHTNLVFRPEIRWDWYDGVGQPFIDNTESNQVTIAGDLVITF